MLLLGIANLIYSDLFIDTGKGAIRSGGALSASSSWLPDYPIENAILREYKYNNDSLGEELYVYRMNKKFVNVTS